jgi:TPR repeat protein
MLKLYTRKLETTALALVALTAFSSGSVYGMEKDEEGIARSAILQEQMELEAEPLQIPSHLSKELKLEEKPPQIPSHLQKMVELEAEPLQTSLHTKELKLDESMSVEDIFDLGVTYYHNMDSKKALSCWNLAAKKGFGHAAYTLGKCFRRGAPGIKKDITLAIKYLEKANTLESFNALAEIYYKGDDVEKNPTSAVGYWKKAANMGDQESLHNLGMCYRKGLGVEKDIKTAIQFFEKAGTSMSFVVLGLIYSEGEDIAKNLTAAAEYWENAANMGDSKACFKLGLCYFEGNGVEKNNEKGLESFVRAASLNKKYYYELGLLYDTGDYLEKDSKKANSYWEIGRQNGEPRCHYITGLHYLDLYKTTGGRKEENYENAVKYLEEAAALGNAEAAEELIELHTRNGLKHDDDKLAQYLGQYTGILRSEASEIKDKTLVQLLKEAELKKEASKKLQKNQNDLQNNFEEDKELLDNAYNNKNWAKVKELYLLITEKYAELLQDKAKIAAKLNQKYKDALSQLDPKTEDLHSLQEKIDNMFINKTDK